LKFGPGTRKLDSRLGGKSEFQNLEKDFTVTNHRRSASSFLVVRDPWQKLGLSLNKLIVELGRLVVHNAHASPMFEDVTNPKPERKSQAGPVD